MTDRDIIDIVKESSLWNALSAREKVEAILYALEASGRQLPFTREEMAYISDVVGETYSGYLSMVSPGRVINSPRG